MITKQSALLNMCQNNFLHSLVTLSLDGYTSNLIFRLLILILQVLFLIICSLEGNISGGIGKQMRRFVSML
jgi:hypothetical protein